MSEERTDRLDFEQALAELEAIVQRMEQGELTLEEALAQFERGIALARRCQRALAEAEQKVDALIGDSEDSPVRPLDDHD